MGLRWWISGLGDKVGPSTAPTAQISRVTESHLIYDRLNGLGGTDMGVRMSESQMRACLAQLETIEAEIEAVIALFGNRQQLFGIERQHAREQLGALKKKLDQEYRRTSSQRGQAGLNRTEKAYYAPAVHDARTRILVKTSSIPDAKWIGELLDAADSIAFYASQLHATLGH